MEEIQQQLNELARLTRLMREAQTKYFKTKTPAALSEAKQKESAVDTFLAKLPDPARPVQGQLVLG
ncbi:hypothetical protein [Spirosoma fluminis]